MNVAAKRLILNQKDFAWVKQTIESLAGIHLTDKKIDLVIGRLTSHIKNTSFENLHDYLIWLQTLDSRHLEWEHFVSCMTTNKTDFFREHEHFSILQEIASAKKSIKLWCAASSTGEEPYSLSYSLAQSSLQNYSIFASDIDQEVLAKAKNGVYSLDRIKELSKLIQNDMFDFGQKKLADWVRVKRKFKEKVHFSKYNLVSYIPPPQTDFDIIFCRNVFIYFRPEVIEKIVNCFYQWSKKDAVLFIGKSETLNSLDTKWKNDGPSIYRK